MGTLELIDFKDARVDKKGQSIILTVAGEKPYSNMEVHLSAVRYVVEPDYHLILVYGYLSGAGLPAVAPYSVALDISSSTGRKGVVVQGKATSKKIDVTP